MSVKLREKRYDKNLFSRVEFLC